MLGNILFWSEITLILDLPEYTSTLIQKYSPE